MWEMCLLIDVIMFEVEQVIFLLQSAEDSDGVVTARSASKKAAQPPPTYYKDKYKHLLGADSGKDAARVTKSNSAYGYGE